MPEQEVDKVLDALAKRLEKIKGIRDVDKYLPDTLSILPRIVLRYMDSPWELSSSRNQINHTIQIEAIVAAKTISKRARKQAVSFLRDVKAELFTVAPGLVLIPSPNQTTISPTGSQAIRNVVYDDNVYFAAILIIRCVEVTGETYG